MSTSHKAADYLDKDFLNLRAKIIDLAASLDRFDRTVSVEFKDPRKDKITQAAKILCSDSANRTEQIQIIFSLPYDEQWRKP